KETGGAVEVLFERLLSPTQFMGMCRASHTPKVGAHILLAAGVRLTVLQQDRGFFTFEANEEVISLLQTQGELPLPPYITHQPNAEDMMRYQTVYAEHEGAVAAPTAGLHFTLELLAQLPCETAMLTLHVGAGTFLPVRENDLSKHQMHSEAYAIDASTQQKISHCQAMGGRVIAVGTTSLRALEAYANSGQASGETNIFITPGHHFKMVDALITNFHLPKSTLLMLVSAFAGMDFIKQIYAHAIEKRYRFFSYGDAMFLEKYVQV
ncbi:MAG: S-adenosylmethionine:tRNA ribosyltransferase-isomerase, partial [Pseudomonadota bacterium]